MTKKMIVSFVLDETGSMQDCKDQTISGFNEYIGTLKGEKNVDNIKFTLTKFNSSRTEIVHDAIKMSEVAEISSEDYLPSSTTPLYDAIGHTVKSVEKSVSGKKRNVLIAIQTDGLENASKEYDQQGIFDLIEEKKKVGWQFAFLGADQDAYAVSAAMGIPAGATMAYAGTPEGTSKAFRNLAGATQSYTRSGGSESFAFDFDKENENGS